MAYENYVIGNPDGTTGTGASFATQLVNNLEALHHAVVIGVMQGWNMAISIGSGSAEMPEFIEYSRGIYRLRKTITWDSGGNVISVLYEFNAASGIGTYDDIGTVTYSYDGSNNLISWTWS